jgi:hypothetical protein
MALGSFLRCCCAGDFRPYFLVEDDDDVDTGMRRRRQIILSDAFIFDVEAAGCFDMEPLTITTMHCTAADADNKQGGETSISLTLQMAPYCSSGATTTACAQLPISGFPRRLITEESAGGVTAKAATVAVPSPSTVTGASSVLARNQQQSSAGTRGDISTGGRVSAMSTTSPSSPLSLHSVSPVRTTYTIASRSSTGSTSWSGIGGLEKLPRRRTEELLIAELPDHGSQAAELPSN